MLSQRSGKKGKTVIFHFDKMTSWSLAYFEQPTLKTRTCRSFVRFTFTQGHVLGTDHTLVLNDPSICKIVTTARSLVMDRRSCSCTSLKILPDRMTFFLDDLFPNWVQPLSLLFLKVSSVWLSIWNCGHVCIGYIQIVLKQLLLLQRRHILIKFDCFGDNMSYKAAVHSCVPWFMFVFLCSVALRDCWFDLWDFCVASSCPGWPAWVVAAASGRCCCCSRPQAFLFSPLGTTRHKQLD